MSTESSNTIPIQNSAATSAHHQSPNNSKPSGKISGNVNPQTSQSVSQEIQKEAVRAFGDDTFVKTEEGETNTWTNLFSAQKISECKQLWNQHLAQWRSVDKNWAEGITKFKEENILSLGDIRVRSVLMAFSAAVLYKCISWNTVGFLRKSRNIGVSFALTGYWFVPELFNPFLKKTKISEVI